MIENDATHDRTTRRLLAAGVVAGLLFMGAALVQAFTRPGFDLSRNAISQLSLGDLGWIQVANFVVTGLLVLCLAAGVRRALRPGRAGTFGPLLLGAYGVGMLGAGIFSTDPQLGFPPGAPAGVPATFSWHANLHNLAFILAFSGLTIACLVLACREAGLRAWGWAAYSAGTGVAVPGLIALAATGAVPASPALVVLGLVTSGWVAVISLRLPSEVSAISNLSPLSSPA
ncbi:MAG TPA: DUF998 domain-containing protein [Candidatus Dormibacteraeota bacterium]|nr:DUF998 domain-containing protein [Candidatus Dormibacteraeota bacterium]